MLEFAAIAFVLGILIGFHEFAHLLMCKLFGVSVARFSFGFGPKLFSFRIGETEYRIALIWLGGFVEPYSVEAKNDPGKGADPELGTPKYKPEQCLESASAWKRCLVYLAGPFSNLFLSMALAIGLFFFVGIPKPTLVVKEVIPNSPAAQVGIQPGDRIVSLNGAKFSSPELFISNLQAIHGAPVWIGIVRNAVFKEFMVTPEVREISPGVRSNLIGVAFLTEEVRQGFFQSIRYGFKFTIAVLDIFYDWFLKLFSGQMRSEETVGGPIMIGEVIVKAARRGWVELLDIMIMISMNLFFFNILPIPLLDGGQIYPALYEVVTRRKPSIGFLRIWQLSGILFLAFLLLLGLRNDLLRLFFK